jgi:hypothetical protein
MALSRAGHTAVGACGRSDRLSPKRPATAPIASRRPVPARHSQRSVTIQL